MVTEVQRSRSLKNVFRQKHTNQQFAVEDHLVRLCCN